MQQSIPVTCIWLSQMNDITIQNPTIFLIPIYNFHYHPFGFRSIIQTRSTITGLHSCSIVLKHQHFILIQMFTQWFKSSSLASPMIFNQWNKTPKRRRNTFPGTIVIQLTGMNQLPVTRQRPVYLPIANSNFS